MAGMSRRDEHTEATKNAIRETALELFSQRGYTDTSLDEIADYARVSKGAIYHHFANKRAVFEAALNGIVADCAARLREQVDVYRSDCWKALTGLLCGYLDACIDPVFYRMMLQEGPIALGWERWRRLEREALLADFFGLAERCAQEDGKTGVPGETLLMSLVSAVQELARAVVASPDRGQATAEAKAFISDLIASVRDRAGT